MCRRETPLERLEKECAWANLLGGPAVIPRFEWPLRRQYPFWLQISIQDTSIQQSRCSEHFDSAFEASRTLWHAIVRAGRKGKTPICFNVVVRRGQLFMVNAVPLMRRTPIWEQKCNILWLIGAFTPYLWNRSDFKWDSMPLFVIFAPFCSRSGHLHPICATEYQKTETFCPYLTFLPPFAVDRGIPPSACPEPWFQFAHRGILVCSVGTCLVGVTPLP
jgi:hypothetical protein